jgi:hypothetical protein
VVTDSWRGFVNGVLYKVQFTRALDDEAADWLATDLIEKPLGRFTPEQEYAALAEALRSADSVTGDMPQPHGEQEMREFLQRVVRRMDARRPWSGQDAGG